MMAHRRDASQKVPYPAPPVANVLGYRSVRCDDIRKRGMDVFSPLEVIPVGWIAQVRKQREMQMVMRVDQSWHDQKAAQIDVYALGCLRERRSSITPNTCKPPVSNLYGASHTIVRANSAADSVKECRFVFFGQF